jgi:RHS repeat-associated protein
MHDPTAHLPTPRLTLAQALWLIGVLRVLAMQGSHRVSNANGKAYSYDANGNVDYAGDATTAISWTTFNQPMALPSAAAANTTTSFKYGADYERRQETIPLPGGGTMERFMLHAGAATFYEEDVKAGSVSNTNTDQRAYLTGPAGPIGVLESRINTSGANIGTTQRYWHRDHLGSTTVNSDETGAEAGRYRYDPWGKPLSGNVTANAVGTGNRGFTGHEHLVGGLIHMNGRIYDPVLGRFLSADIVVQMPHNVQSYNRYSYVLNNPLSYTDPSGYFFWFAVAALFGAFAYATGGVQFARQVLGIAAAILFGPAGPYAAAMATFFGGSFASAVFAGFASGGISSGNIQGAFRGAASAALFFGAGSLADGIQAAAGSEAAAQAAGAGGGIDEISNAFNAGSQSSIAASGGIGRAGLHAIAGCLGALGGGKCGAGALSAAFGELAGPMIPGGKVEGLIGRAIVGGISAELGGGKFANGAMTASFGYLFNYCAHNGCFDRAFRYEDAFAHGKLGNGMAVTDVDPNTLDWSKAKISYKPDNGLFHVEFRSASSQSGLVFGTLSDVRVVDGLISIPRDDYDFDMKPIFHSEGGALANLVRNFFNIGGRIAQGFNYDAYTIHFRQNVKLPADVNARFDSVRPKQ